MTTSPFSIKPGFLPDRTNDVVSFPLESELSFFDIAKKFAHKHGTVALASGQTLDCARYNILGINPWLSLRCSLMHAEITCNGRTETFAADPLQMLHYLLHYYRLTCDTYPLPLCAGLLGYLSYDLKDCIEELPRTSVDDLHLPHAYMVAPSVILVEDRIQSSKTVYVSTVGGDAEKRKIEFLQSINNPPPEQRSATTDTHSAINSCFTREEYLRAVENIRDYIVRGHVYQVNMSQRFETSFDGNAYDLFTVLFKRNPAPFFAYINAGDHYIVSTSPERFIELKNKRVEARPIKGTRPRGKTPAEDKKNREDLANSPKDDAELSMIVDLMRNDIGKVCRAGSVKVPEHKRMEAYENVFHLVSVITGEIDDDKDAIDLIRAAFPGGSITGCPKIRSMKIIDELEPVRRHIYTGSIGYISFHDTMDLSIAIRTAVIMDNRLLFSVGGGIVYDSNPEDEYQETLHKGETLMHAFANAAEKKTPPAAYAWCNGKFRPIEEIMLSVSDEGFMYGYGIFETIRVQNGKPCRLPLHLSRFNRSWQACFCTQVPDISWNEVIMQVVERCGLLSETASVKLLAAAGKPGKPDNVNMLVTARRYVHRLKTIGKKGLSLGSYPNRRYSHLASHKTMNYIYCKMANDWAKQNGTDEAIILNVDGSICETSTANILCIINGTWCRPTSEFVLPGTMEKAVGDLLATRGIKVEQRPITLSELKKADRVFLTNALMGIVPVLSIDETEICIDTTGLCEEINSLLLG